MAAVYFSSSRSFSAQAMPKSTPRRSSSAQPSAPETGRRLKVGGEPTKIRLAERSRPEVEHRPSVSEERHLILTRATEIEQADDGAGIIELPQIQRLLLEQPLAGLREFLVLDVREALPQALSEPADRRGIALAAHPTVQGTVQDLVLDPLCTRHHWGQPATALSIAQRSTYMFGVMEID